MATYDILLPLTPEWINEEDRYEEVDGAFITHLECHLPSGDGKSDSAVLDIYVGDMPADTTAEDEAYANYADIIGWDDEDDEESPISEWRFKNKKAFGFSGECEDGSIMLLMCVEILKGALLIASIIAPDDEAVGKWAKYIEEKLTVRATK
ncbi:MAG: hypothetical protein II809_00855 [Bacteroidales bacterium]|nr:hypothetical protein [Bacteroidales bacterium]MBQ6557427.1 hypothetical protein [Bacteroidales bacterium]MBQ6822639.1 hypothetical protein [Bacteroidales bacterium]MBR0029299.1 hypothetical protein [Bacteroidales bacterium]MBR0082852.1 hypothetical protein [Bacteroidales bacterium]